MPEKRSNYELVINLRDRILKSCELATKSLRDAQNKTGQYKNVNTKTIILQPGDDVLLLLLDVCDRLLVKWQRPFKVFKKISDADYLISILGK